MEFSYEFFRRLLDNTRPGVAFYPIIFSQYDPSHVGPEKDNFKIETLRGFWRQYGYGMVALFKEDFDAAGGFDVKIVGWGMEDVYLVSNVISNGIGSRLTIFTYLPGSSLTLKPGSPTWDVLF